MWHAWHSDVHGCMYVLHIGMCAGTRMPKCVCECRCLKLTSGVFFHWAPFYLVKSGLLLTPEFAILSNLASPSTLGFIQLYSPCPKPGMRTTGSFLVCLVGIYMDAENPNSSPHPCEASTLFTKPSLQFCVPSDARRYCPLKCTGTRGQAFLDPATTGSGDH